MFAYCGLVGNSHLTANLFFKVCSPSNVNQGALLHGYTSFRRDAGALREQTPQAASRFLPGGVGIGRRVSGVPVETNLRDPEG